MGAEGLVPCFAGTCRRGRSDRCQADPQQFTPRRCLNCSEHAPYAHYAPGAGLRPELALPSRRSHLLSWSSPRFRPQILNPSFGRLYGPCRGRYSQFAGDMLCALRLRPLLLILRPLLLTGDCEPGRRSFHVLQTEGNFWTPLATSAAYARAVAELFELCTLRAERCVPWPLFMSGRLFVLGG